MRLGFAGGGTNVSPYCDFFGGSVLNATIDRYVYATVTDLDRRAVAFDIIEKNIHAEYDLAAEHRSTAFSICTKRYIIELSPTSRKPAARHPPFHISKSPPGSGLGSSSALVVAMVQAIVEFFSIPLSEYDVAQLAYQIERVDLGLAGGKQDQYAAAFGGVNSSNFATARS